MIIRRRRRNGMTRLPEITLTPLIDTALVLLVIFMVATPIMHNSLSIDLPEGNMQEGTAPSDSSLVVSIAPPDKFQFNERFYTLENLLSELARVIKTREDKRVYVHCDRKVSSGTLIKLIDSIKYVAGVEHVILSTEGVR